MPICECCIEYYESVKDRTLHLAAAEGNLAVVEFLILRAKWDIEERGYQTRNNQGWDDEENKTALYLACEFGQFPVVKFLLSKGAEVNYYNRYDNDYEDCQNPIVIAAENGHLDVVRILVEKGADKDFSCANEDGGNFYNDTEQRIYLITPLIGAARNGHLQVVRFLLEQGVDKENGDSNGLTALYHAAENGAVIVRAGS